MIALAVVGAVLVSACVQIKTSPSNESETMATETRNVAPFTGIDFALPGTLHVVQSDTPSVQVEAASDIISSIRTEVTNGILTINAAQPIVTTQPITLHILVPTINQISNSGAGTVVSDSQLNTSSLNLTLRGAGTFDIQVNATQLTTQLSGAGTANLRGTATNHTATLTGVGTLELRVADRNDLNCGDRGWLSRSNGAAKTHCEHNWDWLHHVSRQPNGE